MTQLQAQEISHRFGEFRVLNGVEFAVEAGELLCLVGPSGCGKSTLLRLIAGLETLQQGSIALGDEVLADTKTQIPPRERRIGLVFQQASLFPHLDVRANIGFGLRKLPRHEQEQQVSGLLETIGLRDKGKFYPHQLSGGQQQRVALARALAPQPRLMLLDEPFANLDHALRRDMREEVLGMLRQAGIPVVMVTHEPEEALMMADRMLLLRADGRVHQYGMPHDIYRQPVDIEAAAFFGHINRIAARVEGGRIASPFGRWRQEAHGTDFAAEEPLLIVVRPESMRLAYEGEAGAAATILHWRAAGNGWLVSAALDAQENYASVDAQSNPIQVEFFLPYRLGLQPAQGDRVLLACDDVHIFADTR